MLKPPKTMVPYSKTTVDNKEDFKEVMARGVNDLPNTRKETLHNVLDFIFKQIKRGNMDKNLGYIAFETVANNSMPPVEWETVRSMWDEYANKYKLEEQ